ncbi:hypothetical protein D3C87_1008170 [compost metagenome]
MENEVIIGQLKGKTSIVEAMKSVTDHNDMVRRLALQPRRIYYHALPLLKVEGDIDNFDFTRLMNEGNILEFLRLIPSIMTMYFCRDLFRALDLYHKINHGGFGYRTAEKIIHTEEDIECITEYKYKLIQDAIDTLHIREIIEMTFELHGPIFPDIVIGLCDIPLFDVLNEKGYFNETFDNEITLDFLNVCSSITLEHALKDKHFTSAVPVPTTIVPMSSIPRKLKCILNYYGMKSVPYAVDFTGLSDEEITDFSRQHFLELYDYVDAATFDRFLPIIDPLERPKFCKKLQFPNTISKYNFALLCTTNDVESITEIMSKPSFDLQRYLLFFGDAFEHLPDTIKDLLK